MSATVVGAIAAIAAAILLSSWALFWDPDRQHRLAVANLHRDLGADARDLPAIENRPEQPSGFLGVARRLTPASATKRLDLQLAKAGRPREWPLSRVLVVKVLLGAAGAMLGFLLFLGSPDALRIVVWIALAAGLYFLPDLLVYNTSLKRRESIQLELADTLDQMVIAVEAGLGFEAAMAHAARNGTGVLAEELIRTLQDIQVGQSRRASYQALSARNDVQDLRRFISAVIQADVYGVAIGDVLRTQAAEMRLKRRQRAEEKAMQVPVKIVIPLVLCILPVLFIVILGPAAIDIAGMFSQL